MSTETEKLKQQHLEAIKAHGDFITDDNEAVDDFKYNDLATACTALSVQCAIDESNEWLSELNKSYAVFQNEQTGSYNDGFATALYAQIRLLEARISELKQTLLTLK